MNNFYEYWVNFESWRDFSLQGEHDVEDAHDRYEKRWMIKENDRKSKVQYDTISYHTIRPKLIFLSCALKSLPRAVVGMYSTKWWLLNSALCGSCVYPVIDS